MSEENVALVARLYELWNQGPSERGRTEAAELLHPQFKYVNPSDAVEPGTLEGFGGFDKVREIFPENRAEPEQYLEVGDDVLVILRSHATTESGLAVDWRGAHMWTVRGGKATAMRWFNDVEEARKAVGLRE